MIKQAIKIAAENSVILQDNREHISILKRDWQRLKNMINSMKNTNVLSRPSTWGHIAAWGVGILTTVVLDYFTLSDGEKMFSWPLFGVGVVIALLGTLASFGLQNNQNKAQSGILDEMCMIVPEESEGK